MRERLFVFIVMCAHAVRLGPATTLSGVGHASTALPPSRRVARGGGRLVVYAVGGSPLPERGEGGGRLTFVHVHTQLFSYV